jgi:hypothetical protein
MSVYVRAAALSVGLLALTQSAGQTCSAAPLVDAETLAVAHVDLSRGSVDAIVDFIGQRMPDEKPSLAAQGRKAAELLQTFRRAGGRDVYLLVSVSTPGPLSGVLLEIPLGPQADETAIRALLGPAAKSARRVGDCLVLPAGPTAAVPAAFQPIERPELAQALAAVSDAPVQVALIPPASARRVVEELLPQLPPAVGGGSSTVFTRGMRWAALGIDLPPQLAARFVIQATDAQTAAALQAQWAAGIEFARQAEPVRQLVPEVDQLSTLLAPHVEGDRWLLTLDHRSPTLAQLLGVANRALEAARIQSRRVRSASNLRQIGLAMANCELQRNRLLAPASVAADGRPLLSWRVHLLPYLAQETLYRQFHLDEAWDSPHNKTLIARMPPVYRSPALRAGPGMTNYLLPVGPGALYASIKDQPATRGGDEGLSHKVMCVEVDAARAVTWTKPDDWSFDPQHPLAGLGHAFPDGFHVGMTDGSTRFLSSAIDAQSFRLLVAHGKEEK